MLPDEEIIRISEMARKLLVESATQERIPEQFRENNSGQYLFLPIHDGGVTPRFHDILKFDLAHPDVAVVMLAILPWCIW